MGFAHHALKWLELKQILTCPTTWSFLENEGGTVVDHHDDMSFLKSVAFFSAFESWFLLCWRSLVVWRIEEADKGLRRRKKHERGWTSRLERSNIFTRCTGISVYPWKMLCQLGLSA